MNLSKIVFINQATGYLTIDIINSFTEKFDEVALIAGSIRVQEVKLKDSVKWIKIIKYNRGNPVKKSFSWLWGTLQIFFLLLTRFRKYDVFYITVPPTAYLLSLLLPNKFSILVYDIYPEALKVFNIKETNFLYRKWQKWNIAVFSKAHKIFTLGDSMQKELVKYVDPCKITIVNNWSGLLNIKPVPKSENPFISNHRLNEKFIVSYSGNIGHTHNVEVLIKVAEELKYLSDILFLIIGRGERFNIIKEIINSRGLTNCVLLPFQPDTEIQNSLSAADISVVILDEKVSGSSIPSKTYNLLAVGSAFMCIGSDKSELAVLVRKNMIGVSFPQNDIQGMVEYILDLKNNSARLQLYRSNSLSLAADYTSKNAALYLKHYLEERSDRL